MSTTRFFLSSMANVLRETSQDREYLNRLRSFGLSDLSDAYLVSIDTSDGQHVRHIPLTCAYASATREAHPRLHTYLCCRRARSVHLTHFLSQLLRSPGLQVGSVSPAGAPAAAPSMAAAPGLTGQYTPGQAPGWLLPQGSTAFPWADSAQGPAQPTRLVPSWTPAAIQGPSGPAQVCCSV